MSWRETELTARWGLRVPIVQAPMAGGWTTPELVAAVSNAGGLGSIAGAMLPPEQLRQQIHTVRSLTGGPFAVNLFAPQPAPTEAGLAEWAALTGQAVPRLPSAGIVIGDQLAVVVDERVPVLSFTFGIVDVAGVDAFTVGTATTAAEAVALSDAGVDAVIAQGSEAGGHRGTFLGTASGAEPPEALGTMALVPQIADAIALPVIASGGMMDGKGIAAARILGAAAVQLGTAFLRTDEAGTGPEYRAALDRPTSLTRVLTGRYARAVRTPLVQRLEASGVQPPDYPLPRLFLREAPMLAGQGGPMARSMPAADLVAALEREASEALAAMAG